LVEVPRVIFVFIDGLGIGPPDPEVNPLLVAEMPTLVSWVGTTDPDAWRAEVKNAAATLVPLDATLGVDGLPQSATGQTSLYTGVNAARVVGRHMPGYPNKALQAVLSARGVLPRLARAGRSPAFVNAYTFRNIPEYFARRRPLSVTTVMSLAAFGGFRTAPDVRRGEAVFHDLTNRGLKRRGENVPVIEPREAGEVIARVGAKHDFTLFEYFLTDLAGHRQKMHRAVLYLEDVDGMLGGIKDGTDFTETLLIVTSDHGNVEDLGTRGHTRNPVPFVAVGPARDRFDGLKSITDVTPACLRLLGVKR
jgi:2,3-bisphosphoglycerate-independent phosphoglycerate mutase